MAHSDEVNNSDVTYGVAMNQLLQDVVKKARQYRQKISQAIANARAGFTGVNDAVVIERVGPLSDFGNLTCDPLHVPGN